MIFDLDAHEGEWFPFFESRLNGTGAVEYLDPREDAGRVCIRSLTPYFDKLQSTRKRKHEFVLNQATRQMERVGYFEEPGAEQNNREREDAWDYAITGIENIFDAKGNEITCTRENKLRLMALPVFDRFLARCLQLLAESGVKTAEVQEKNG